MTPRPNEHPKTDKKETTPNLNMRNWVSLIFLLFFRSDNSILMEIQGLKSVALLWQEGSLKMILHNDKQTFEVFSFSASMKVDANEWMISSND